MILLDTNVLSEFMRAVPAAAVVNWLDGQKPSKVWVCAISQAEIGLGIALLPDGRRKAGLAEAARCMFDQDFAGRCLPFDVLAAKHYVQVIVERNRAGRPVSVEDAQIAAVALAHGLMLATRNLRDFEQIPGLRVVNPWQD